MSAISSDLPNWTGRAAPLLPPTVGRTCRLEPWRAADHAGGMVDAIGRDADLWRHIPIGPFDTAEALAAAFDFAGAALGWRTHVLFVGDRPAGMASYMRLRPEHGSAEVGCIVYGRPLQKTPAATEAMFIMARHLFDDLGYRRYEWKCDNANAASKRAAERLGFTFEGVFRNDMVMKGRSRDTAWFSITDAEWPRVKAALEAWLAPGNFDAEGRQRRALADFRRSR